MTTELPPQGTLAMIDEELRQRKEKKRSYLGASVLGYACDRRVWYHYHLPEKQTPVGARLRRIFDMGHMIEEYLVNILTKTGMIVWDKKEDGSQFGFVDGEIAGHCDGIIKNIPESSKPHLLEIKTMNKNSFSKVKKEGVKLAFHHYFVQMQVYMLKLKLEKALFISYCKDNSELYQERIDFDPVAAGHYLNRGKELVDKSKEPTRKFKSSAYFECKFCPFREECWKC